MRSLKQFQPMTYHGRWERHQQEMIAREVRTYCSSRPVLNKTPLCGALFPGSLLFNQIAVADVGAVETEREYWPTFETLNAVYQSIMSPGWLSADDYFLIDCPHADDEVLPYVEARIRRLQLEYPGCQRVAVLGGNAAAKMTESIASLGLDLEFIKPEWYSAHQHVTAYRQALHCVFVDSCRVIDAVMTECSSTLIATRGFVRSLKTDVLIQCLSSSAFGEVIQTDFANSSEAVGGGWVLCENRVDDLHLILSRVAAFDAAVSGGFHQPTTCADKNSPDSVITRPVLPVRDFFDAVALHRVSAKRKFCKLREDPKGFFNDSSYALLRILAQLFPDRAAVRQDA
ncbi:hypothetical protein AB833_30345 [Chromatiales bacterium (ex Bugula neritina AB1)]|nr:hypothetical protein AB833_30345 [Chromatiales bacterium (ex Bugula neritina AB1)]